MERDLKLYGTVDPAQIEQIKALRTGRAGPGKLVVTRGALPGTAGLQGISRSRVWSSGSATVQRVESVFAELKPAALNRGTGTTAASRVQAQGAAGGAKVDAGHMIGRQLGGKGGAGPSIFPQNAHVNRGAQAQVENALAASLRSGHTVHARIRMLYGSDPLVPEFVSYQARVNGVTRRLPPFRNR